MPSKFFLGIYCFVSQVLWKGELDRTKLSFSNQRTMYLQNSLYFSASNLLIVNWIREFVRKSGGLVVH